MQDHGLEQDKRLTPAGEPALRARPASRWWPPTTRTTCARTMPARTKSCMCIQTGKTMSRSEPHAIGAARFLPEVARRDDGAVRRAGGRRSTAPGRSRSAATSSSRRSRSRSRGSTSRPSTPPTPTSNTSRGRASKSAAPRLEALRAAGRAEARSRGVRRAPGSRNQDDPADEVLRLLPDRLGLHPLRQDRKAFRWVRAADRPPEAWSATRWRSPISIRCSTACCSSAS